ncbi:MAG: hypothetical protein J0M37_06090 [Ignavibacteria bacterium]|nr:hypothetical protein [Ignavibacteria bacterium]
MLQFTVKTAAIFLIMFVFNSVSFSQNDGTPHDKVKAALSNMPDKMNAGETITITVTITNTGTTTWTNANLTTKELGQFEISKLNDVVWTLEPGQSKDLQYQVKAPEKPGTYRMKIIVNNGDKKIGSRSKKVSVVSSEGSK